MPKERYSRILLIYNPNSTSGTAETRARRLERRLVRAGLDNVYLTATEYAGHAEDIAYQTAKKYRHPLLISVSGDGGYNEVINGALRAARQDRTRRPVCAILAAGNANDHRRTVKRNPLSRAILRGQPEAIDVLRLEARVGRRRIVRFAHSYIGFGITAGVARNLNREQLTRWREVKIALSTTLHFRYFRIRLSSGEVLRLDSLVFANIHRMSKYFRVGKKTDLHNGKFMLALVPHQTLPSRFLRIVGILLLGYKEDYRRAPYEFTIPKSQIVHFDGEVTTLPGGAHIRVEADQESLLTLR